MENFMQFPRIFNSLRTCVWNKLGHVGVKASLIFATVRMARSILSGSGHSGALNQQCSQKNKVHFRNELKLISSLLEKSSNLWTIDADDIDMDLESSFTVGLEFVRENIEYIFLNRNWVNWSASYFCKKIKYSSIIKHGTEDDKRRAEMSKTYNNKKRRSSRV